MSNPGSINPSDLTTGQEYPNTLMIAVILAPYYPERSEGLVRGQVQNPKSKKNYDLSERTAKFGEDIIEFCKSLPDTPINRPLISQLIRAGTSIGANYLPR